MKDKDYGLMNNKGKLIIPCEYTTTVSFEGGGAATKGNTTIFFDMSGRILGKTTKQLLLNLRYGTGTVREAYVSKGVAIFVERVNGIELKGLVNVKGQIVHKADFSGRPYLGDDGSFCVYSKIKDKWLVFDSSGRRYKEFPKGVVLFPSGYRNGLVRATDRSGTVYFDKNGRKSLKSDSKKNLSGDFYDGLIRYQDTKTQKYGFLNNRGRIAIKALYENSDEQFSEGLAWATKDRKHFLLAINGDAQAVNLNMRKYSSFSEGLCAVQVDQKVGFINKEAEFVIEPKYRSNSFKRGIFTGFKGGLSMVFGDKGLIYIDKSGKVIPFFL
jgi:hypothetical protein